MEHLISWLIAFMVAKAPTPDTDRYREIATDIAEVVTEQEPVYGGRHARFRTAALVASIMWHESKFAVSVDQRLGRERRRSMVCMMQINVGHKRTREGWSAQDLIQDRRKCVEAGLHIVQHSFEACRHLPESSRLRAYVSGSCSKGQSPSAARIRDADSWYFGHLPRFDDNVLLGSPSMASNFHTPIPTDGT
jgi:hypothetical protein